VSLLEITDVSKTYRQGGFLGQRVRVRVLTGITLAVEEGECLGLVGPSGCGKSTLGRLALGLEQPDSGQVRFQGCDLGALRARDAQRIRRELQAVFQDALGSVNPRFTAGAIIAEPLENFEPGDRPSRRRRVGDLLELVGLSAADAAKYPHQFSGGELQRVCIARALALNPRLIVLDEAVSSLDMLVQARVLDLLADLRRRLGLAYLFISHDLRVILRMAQRLVIMADGRIVTTLDRLEPGTLGNHPALRALVEATPAAEPVAEQVAGRRRRARREASGLSAGSGSPPTGNPRDAVGT
jgi:nickel transport system ATP-binding protein